MKSNIVKNNKTIIAIIIIILIISLCVGITYKLTTNNNEPKEETKSFNSNTYTIVTDFRWKTMLNDGGSNTSIYYEIDLENNNVNKITESYHANLGGTPETNKKSVSIKINNELSKEIDKTLNNILESDNEKDSTNYDFYTIKSDQKQKDIYNKDTINTLKELIEKIEKE